MNIAITAPAADFPRVKRLAELLHHWKDLGRHSYRVYCTPGRHSDIQQIFNGLPVQVIPNLPAINRLPPMTDNEPFYHAASRELDGPWVFLPPDTLPLAPDWADKLEKAYISAQKPYLGIAGYIPRRFKDSAGIERVHNGSPYMLQAAIYPPKVLTGLRAKIMSPTAHHEVTKANEMFHMAHLGNDLIVSAEWNPNFRLVNAHGAVLATRLAGDAVFHELLGQEVAPPVTVTIEKEVPASQPQAPAPLKEPTMRIVSRRELEVSTVEDSLTVAEDEHSTIPVDEVTLPVRRRPGRPAKKKK
jgi:hypothetical protein